MAASLLIKSPASIAGPARPKATRHPLIRPGTKFLFDFTDSRCHPAGAIVPGAVPAGTGFIGLGGVSAVAEGGGYAINADGTLTSPGAAGQIKIGAAGQFDMSGSPSETVMILWAKLTAVPGIYTRLLGLTASDGNAAQAWIDSGPSASQLNPRGGAGGVFATVNGVSLNVVHQIAVHFVPGVKADIYIDGVLASSWVSSVPTSLTPAPAAFFTTPAVWAGRLYGMSYHDIAASIAAEAALGFKAADILSGPRHIARDFAFATGALAGAPKTAFA